MKNTKKHWSEKSCDEMDYGEFTRWAKEFVVTHFLKDGLSGMNYAVETIVSMCAINSKFGGHKKLTNNTNKWHAI